MSKYDALWDWLKRENSDSQKLTFSQIEEISGIPIDHSFLKHKKELSEFGFFVDKISLKEKTVTFRKIKEW